MWQEVNDFILHLRLKYQFLILSGAFLSGTLLSKTVNTEILLIHFFTIHILLFGGVTAYNSYYDKDEGPIGGLKHPPKMKPWMLVASWVFQLCGLFIVALQGTTLTALYCMSMLFFWMYSTPLVRLKGTPILSIVSMGMATGIGGFFMGFYSAGGGEVILQVIQLALGMTFSFMAVYPISQIYQIDEDRKRGDTTFAVRYGLAGVKKLFLVLFPLGILLSGNALRQFNMYVFVVFMVGAMSIGVLIWSMIRSLRCDASSYDRIMSIKYISGTTFSFFVAALLLLKILYKI